MSLRITRGEGWWLVRRRMSLRQHEMALLLGISEDRLRRWEKDREAAPMPDRATLRALLTIGEWCTLQRRRAGWDMAEVARRAGVSRMTVWKSEHDRTSGARVIEDVFMNAGPFPARSAAPLEIRDF